MRTGELDTERFAELIEPHFDRLYRLAYRLTGSRSDAEDLVQDVMIKIYEQRETLDAVTDLKPWLSRVLYNRFVDGVRARNRRPLTLVGDDADALGAAEPDDRDPTNPELLAGAREDANRLEQALGRVSEDHRSLLLMHDAEGYTLPEIEAMTNIPLGTLKSRLSRARARLRELLWDLPHAAKHGREAAQQAAVQKKMEPFSSTRRVGG
jgi:RNA polymerase sigma-70 factor (ECF subfamily)